MEIKFFCKKHKDQEVKNNITGYFGFWGYCPQCKKLVPVRRTRKLLTKRKSQ